VPRQNEHVVIGVTQTLCIMVPEPPQVEQVNWCWFACGSGVWVEPLGVEPWGAATGPLERADLAARAAPMTFPLF
jgi:hypothetical protein